MAVYEKIYLTEKNRFTRLFARDIIVFAVVVVAIIVFAALGSIFLPPLIPLSFPVAIAVINLGTMLTASFVHRFFLNPLLIRIRTNRSARQRYHVALQITRGLAACGLSLSRRAIEQEAMTRIFVKNLKKVNFNAKCKKITPDLIKMYRYIARHLYYTRGPDDKRDMDKDPSFFHDALHVYVEDSEDEFASRIGHPSSLGQINGIDIYPYRIPLTLNCHPKAFSLSWDVMVTTYHHLLDYVKKQQTNQASREGLLREAFFHESEGKQAAAGSSEDARAASPVLPPEMDIWAEQFITALEKVGATKKMQNLPPEILQKRQMEERHYFVLTHMLDLAYKQKGVTDRVKYLQAKENLRGQLGSQTDKYRSELAKLRTTYFPNQKYPLVRQLLAEVTNGFFTSPA
ncbi:MAG: hypothetical protein A3F09_01040 [Chlamydiae bacterium RIFCSPHIGHO2_12_FULL_49_11]|nr:MAG: hypothetical protein A3F09_01040 [Chlamydiae bacterium RIFCSPHIGHO2_12_FULL_49_11]